MNTLNLKNLKNDNIYIDYYVKVTYNHDEIIAVFSDSNVSNDSTGSVIKKFKTFREFLNLYKKFVKHTHKENINKLFNKKYICKKFFL